MHLQHYYSTGTRTTQLTTYTSNWTNLLYNSVCIDCVPPQRERACVDRFYSVQKNTQCDRMYRVKMKMNN